MSTEKTERPTWLELERVCSMPEAEEITSLSEDTILRNHAEKVVRLSRRRRGIKLRHVLQIASGE